jgi:hypothetical protein
MEAGFQVGSKDNKITSEANALRKQYLFSTHIPFMQKQRSGLLKA